MDKRIEEDVCIGAVLDICNDVSGIATGQDAALPCFNSMSVSCEQKRV